MSCKGRALLRSAFVLLLVFGTAAAQAPVAATAPTVPMVPTDHYGPPTCPGVSLRSGEFRDRAASARAEQAAGADDPHALPSAEPMENFQIVRYRLHDYADCLGTGGCYWADLDAQFRRAEEALTAQVAHRHAGEKLALVMDIDETSLSSYCEMRREDFGYLGANFNAWVVSPEAAVAIPGGVRLINEAKQDGVAVFFITGRPGVPDYATSPNAVDQTAATARNLQAAGYHGWTGLLLRNGTENGMSTIEYKSGERAKIAAQGYRIVLSVGDQWSDLEGEPRAEVSVKLPNPFYFLP